MDRLTSPGFTVTMTQHHRAAGGPVLLTAAATGHRVARPPLPAPPARPGSPAATPPAAPTGPERAPVTGGRR